MTKFDLSIIAVNGNIKNYLRQCLQSFLAAVGNVASEVDRRGQRLLGWERGDAAAGISLGEND